jgi:hypothetical protein
MQISRKVQAVKIRNNEPYKKKTLDCTFVFEVVAHSIKNQLWCGKNCNIYDKKNKKNNIPIAHFSIR